MSGDRKQTLEGPKGLRTDKGLVVLSSSQSTAENLINILRRTEQVTRYRLDFQGRPKVEMVQVMNRLHDLIRADLWLKVGYLGLALDPFPTITFENGVYVEARW